MIRLPFLLRLALTKPDPKDEQWAARVAEDGSWEHEWVKANTEHPVPGMMVFPSTPQLTTPQVVEMIKDCGVSRRTIRFSERQMRLDQARWPKLFAALSRKQQRS